MNNGIKRMITVVNKRTHIPTEYDVYIGRGSLVGNPFTHMKGKTKAQEIVLSREEAIEKYKEWIVEQYKSNKEVKRFIKTLARKELVGEEIYLVCYCMPLACHGSILKKMIEIVAKRIEGNQ